MAFDFTADDVFEMAERIERNGAEFYRKAAGNVDDPSQTDLLKELAAMEDQHERTFSEMRGSLSEDLKKGTVFDPEGDAAQYLKALADHRVFFEKDLDTSSMKGILKSALVAEKDSIVFYLGMKDVVPDKLGKEWLDNIIKEEMSHITRLTRELKALKA